jgi:hypothetical protein
MKRNQKKQLVQDQRQTLEDERSAESKLRREKRKATGRAQEIAKAVKRSPAGRKAAETLTAKRGEARKKEQASYQKRRARSATRLGGKRKQTQTALHDKTEE